MRCAITELYLGRRRQERLLPRPGRWVGLAPRAARGPGRGEVAACSPGARSRPPAGHLRAESPPRRLSASELRRRGGEPGRGPRATLLTALLANSVGPPARTRLGEAGTGRRGVAGWAPAPCASSFPYKNINALFSVKLGFGFRLLSSSTWNNTDSERVFIKSRNRTKHTAYM